MLRASIAHFCLSYVGICFTAQELLCLIMYSRLITQLRLVLRNSTSEDEELTWCRGFKMNVRQITATGFTHL